MIRDQRGQLLVEAILAIALVGILAGIIGATVNVSTQSNKAASKRSVAAQLAQESLEALRAIRDTNETTGRGWNKIFIPSNGKGSANLYDPEILANVWVLSSVSAPGRTIAKDGVDFIRSLYIENVCRDARNGGGDIVSTGTCNESSNFNDPSTQFIKVTVTASGIPDIIVDEYLTRAKNEIEAWDTKLKFETGATCTSTHVNDSTGFVELKSGSGC